MSATGTVMEADHDIRGLPAYLGTKADGYLTTGPDSKYIAQYTLSLRDPHEPASLFHYESLVQYGAIEQNLRALMTAPEADHFGLVRPSLTAFTATRKLLFMVAATGY